jgi:Domain of unknown function (DUF4124)
MRSLTIVLMLLASAGAQAQIYTCKAKDGSIVFSDQKAKCGAGAQLVKGSASKAKPMGKKPAAATAPAPRVKRSPEELEMLLEKCDGGDTPSCNAWTLGGGPNLLRENERKAELDCEAGLLPACEERYCREGMSDECRERVMRTARLAGETWYVRSEDRMTEDGSTRYAIRCLPKTAAGNASRKPSQSRDIVITCSALAGPNRCFMADPQRGHSGLGPAATAQCSS